MPIKEEIWAKAIDDIIMRTDGDIEKMTVSDLIVMKILADTMLEHVDGELQQYLLAWNAFDIEKWLKNADLDAKQRLLEATRLSTTTTVM